jgi:hypothetical protein
MGAAGDVRVRMLSLGGQMYARRGPFVSGLPIKPRMTRRIARARERAQMLRWTP